MFITPAVLEALRTEFSLAYEGGYGSAPLWYQAIASDISSSTKSNTYGWVEKALKVRKWVGPREAQNLASQKYVLENEPYELTVEVDRDDIEDDNLGQYSGQIIPMFGTAVAQHPQTLIADMMADNTALAWDGEALFSANHVIGSTTYDNLDGLALSADNLNTVYSYMSERVDETGRSLGVTPSHLFHAPRLKRTALEICNATNAVRPQLNAAGSDNVGGAAIDNVMRGWVTPVEVPEWAALPKMWVVADCTKAIKPFVRQTRRPFTFVARDNPQDPKVFDLKKYTYGTEGRMAIGITLPWLIHLGNKST